MDRQRFRRRRIALSIVLATGAVATLSTPEAAAAPWTVTNLTTVTAADLAQTLVGEGVAVSNVSYVGDPLAAGTFSDPAASIGLVNGVVLSSGSVSDVVGPNNLTGSGDSLGEAGDTDLNAIVTPLVTRDASVLSFNFVPTTSQLKISYVFASEEYKEFVGTAFNDVFAFYVNGTNCALVPGTADRVTVNNINALDPSEPLSGRNSTFYIDNPEGTGGFDTQFDGFTVVLNCFASVNAGVTNTLKLAIADTTDFIYDSAVFLQAGGITSTAVGACNPVASPDRLVDTRTTGNKVQPGTPLEVTVIGGPAGVPATSLAVSLNVTATEADGDGYLTVYPAGIAPPEASNVNYVAGGTSPNAVVVKVGANGKIAIATQRATHVIVDIFGWCGPGANGRLLPVAPGRLVDTRSSGTKVDPLGNPLRVQVTGQNNIPTTGVSAAIVNVTAVDAEGAGYLTVFPSGTQRPGTSNVNYSGPDAVPNTVIAPLGADGAILIYSQVKAHVIVDVMGWFGSAGVQEYNVVTPTRMIDTRTDNGGVKILAGTALDVQIAGVRGIPAIARGVVVNVTAVSPDGSGFLSVYPGNGNQPATSNVNFVAGQTIPNAVLVGLSPTGKLKVFASATTHVIVDITGWYS